MGVGIQYVTEFQNPVTSQSGHVVVDGEGCWSNTNLVYDAASDTWIDPCAQGLTGNFAIRVQFEPLCPDKVGDIEGDGDIDVRDFAPFQAAFTGLNGDAFARPTIYSDLNNDLVVDPNDFNILLDHFTGPDVFVSCPDPNLLPISDNPDVPLAARQAPDQGATSTERWTYTQVAVVLGILLLLYTLFVGPRIQSACRVTNAANFASGGTQVTTLEEDRIQAAIDFLQTMGDADSDAAYFFLAQPQYYNARIFQKIKIDHSVSEDDTEFAATRSFDVIVLHHTFVTGDHWDQWGMEGLVLVLFAEWQHLEQPGWTERQVQEWLMDWRERTSFEDVAPEFGHGFGD